MMIGNVKFLSPKEALSISGLPVVFIDIRPDFETPGQRIRVHQLVYLPDDAIYQQYTMLDPEKHFIIFDAVGIHSKEAVIFLQDKGFKNVASMAGGITDWERDGLPMDIDKKELLTGSCACTLKPKKKFDTQ